ncbi:MAG: glycosyltransferase family 2 protein [Pedobacter sp.]|nr:MAG: glycosyltransferase family 2 protein [Pedobacter sp.]
MNNYISVILPTHNPNEGRLDQTLLGLKNQTLLFQYWELIIIDNNSSNIIDIDLSWHPNAKITREENTGLTYARLKGFKEASGSIIIMVDDDNILQADYLERTLFFFTQYSKLGAMGGKSFPIFEAAPPKWLDNFYGNLALRNLGDDTIIDVWMDKYPESAPIGAGMAIRKEALKSYIKKISSEKDIIHDRKGNSLSSGGDNDIVLELLKEGWQIGYFPELILNHIIPKERTEAKYLARLINNSNKSWIELLDNHGINPWNKIPKWTVPFRKFKSWFTYSAWKNPVNYIKWQGACGTFDGLAK